jgi:peptidoglycan pentaglycine glycine transferase (the first glycine)
MSILSFSDWNQYLNQFPNAHILQTGEWGLLKSEFGWTPMWVANKNSGAQILFRKLPFGYSVGYIPKGPLGNDWHSIWEDVDALCLQRKAIFLRAEPDAWEADTLKLIPQMPGFSANVPTIQPRRTILIDLRCSEEDIINRMKQKTRYNIHLAEKKNVTVSSSNDIAIFYQLMTSTGERDQFGIHTRKYYERAFSHFSTIGKCRLFLAEYQGIPLAGILVFVNGNRAWYFYGASSNIERNRMPTYLLQWEAIRWAKSKGCQEYDLWGVPDHPLEDLEEQFEHQTKGLWKVYRFKRGFGGELKRSACAWDKVYQPVLYRLYQWWLSHRGGLS